MLCRTKHEFEVVEFHRLPPVELDHINLDAIWLEPFGDAQRH